MDSIIRGVAIYLLLVVIIRASGRRTMAQATPFDFVLLLIVAETTQQALLGDDFSITNAVLLIVTLFMLDIGLSYLKRWSPAVSKVIDGRPTFLIHDGKIDERALRKTRMDTADIMMSARAQHGLERLDQIKHAVLENDAGITIIPRPSSQ
ncbi:DUF421 domain-containing protein [Altererythrobacter sp. C41]|uniref:DUF421 domain-containing protein n=1 Tax=Altererythrobacter sp. C41 TaxID=2806021 RepID=UPI0019331E5C|nr:YetF domain-containing protein [Altererythrobacter sp. C41]MBM0169898.1 DUF421 domain-containing protein [Altererythrobacter sp. C41]